VPPINGSIALPPTGRHLATERVQGGTDTTRVFWPIALAYFEKVRVLAAWCELRTAYRHSGTGRISGLKALVTGNPRRRSQLLKEWRAITSINSWPE
jgi:predicted DNA-binding transcriptional regulator YafY